MIDRTQTGRNDATYEADWKHAQFCSKKENTDGRKDSEQYGGQSSAVIRSAPPQKILLENIPQAAQRESSLGDIL
jgi:hypothetical protein